MKVPSSIPTKIAAIVGVLIIVTVGVIGYEAGTSNLFKGNSVPALQIMGNGTTDAGNTVHLWVRFGSIPPSIPFYMWFVNGNYSIGNTLNQQFGNSGNYTITLRVSFENNKTQVTDYAKETVNPALSASASISNTSVKSGQKIYLNSTVKNGTPPYKFQWSISNIYYSGTTPTTSFANSSAQNTTLIITGTGMFTIDYTVTDSIGDSIMRSFSVYT